MIRLLKSRMRLSVAMWVPRGCAACCASTRLPVQTPDVSVFLPDAMHIGFSYSDLMRGAELV